MPSLARIITVDPIGNTARVVRAIIDLSDYACRQVDVPTGEEALEELQLGGASLIVSALKLDDMSAMALVEQAQQTHPEAAVIVLADETDPLMAPDEQHERGCVYFRRPLDIQKFASVIFAGMRGVDIFDALRKASQTNKESGSDFGPVPPIHTDSAGSIVDKLLIDLGAMAIFLIGRDGSLLLERGADNYLDRQALLDALMPTINSTINMRDIVGGEATMLQFYDGDHRDIYTLSVGLHHMLCIAYDGEKGQREFGMVNRLGRKAAMDLIALLGAEAFMLRRARPEAPPDDELPRRTMATPRVQADDLEEPVQLERATEFVSDAPEIERVTLEAISDDEFDPSFLDQLDNLDDTEAEQLFGLESLENSELNIKLGKTISRDDAEELGLL